MSEDEIGGEDGVLAATDIPVAIDVREIEDHRVPEGMSCLGTFVDGRLVARCAVPAGVGDLLMRSGAFDEPRQLVLLARTAQPGLKGDLYAVIPMPPDWTAGEEQQEPWAASVPSSGFDRDIATESDGERMAAVHLGHIVRFQRDRRHPDSLPLEAADLLGSIVSGKVSEVVDKLLEDLLGGARPGDDEDEDDAG